MPSPSPPPTGRPRGRRDLRGRALRVRNAQVVGLAYQAAVGRAVRAMREALELSQDELAAGADMPRSRLVRLELGRPRRFPRHLVGRRWWVNLDDLRRVAGAMGVRVSDLLPEG